MTGSGQHGWKTAVSWRGVAEEKVTEESLALARRLGVGDVIYPVYKLYAGSIVTAAKR